MYMRMFYTFIPQFKFEFVGNSDIVDIFVDKNRLLPRSVVCTDGPPIFLYIYFKETCRPKLVGCFIQV